MRVGLHSKRVVVGGEVVEATVIIDDGKVFEVIQGPLSDTDVEVKDLGDKVIMPGLIDPHIHINEPGRTEWEGFETATKAAAAGGITTLVEMPLNASPVTTTQT